MEDEKVKKAFDNAIELMEKDIKTKNDAGKWFRALPDEHKREILINGLDILDTYKAELYAKAGGLRAILDGETKKKSLNKSVLDDSRGRLNLTPFESVLLECMKRTLPKPITARITRSLKLAEKDPDKWLKEMIKKKADSIKAAKSLEKKYKKFKKGLENE